jgi:hypothetical protein
MPSATQKNGAKTLAFAVKQVPTAIASTVLEDVSAMRHIDEAPCSDAPAGGADKWNIATAWDSTSHCSVLIKTRVLPGTFTSFSLIGAGQYTARQL